MKNPVQRLGTLTIALLAAALLIWAFLPKPVPVDLGTVTLEPMRVTIDEDGVTRIKKHYSVSSPLPGRLRRIDLEPGDAVHAGKTLLAIIEPVNPELLDARSRAEAEARLHAAEAAVELAAAQEVRARADYAQASSDLDRARQLFADGVISKQEIDRAETSEQTHKETLKAATFASQIAVFEVEQARAAMASYVTEGKENAVFEIRSPIDGRVLRRWQESATVVTPGSPLLELGNPSDLEIVVDVLSEEGVRIQPGATMILERWGGPNPLKARVRLVEPSAFMKISALGVEEQRVNVIADLLDPPEQRPNLGDAYRVEAHIVVWESDEVLTAPTSALFWRNNQWAVFLVENEKARLRPVEIGQQNGLQTEIRKGLKAGEKVVLHPGDRIQDGIGVKRREE